jgi:hypothetical protein
MIWYGMIWYDGVAYPTLTLLIPQKGDDRYRSLFGRFIQPTQPTTVNNAVWLHRNRN